jgi:hypothetical protein
VENAVARSDAALHRFLFRRSERLDGTTLLRIRRLIRSGASKTRTEIARRLCRFFDWKRPSGDWAVRSCTGLLARLERHGLVRLPVSRRKKGVLPAAGKEAPAVLPLEGFEVPREGEPRLVVRPLRPREGAVWRALLRQHHYLREGRLIGESLGYVAFWERQPAAVLGWASAALHNEARDRWVGWDGATKRARLHFIVNNVRFLMLPGERVGGLASQVLAGNLRRLSGDWERVYGHPVWLAETFVDPQRFRGTCYRASNWVCVGETRGWSKKGCRYQHHGVRKLVFVYALDRRAREWLGAREEPQGREPSGGRSMVDVTQLPLEGQGSLLEVLATVRDPRHRRGIRHSLLSILAMGVAAILCQARSIQAIGEWAANLPEEVRQRLGGRRKAPSESTFRRNLYQVDAEEVDRKVGAWMAQQACFKGQGLALDGKTVRGSRDGEKPGVHLLSAVLHREGVVVAQVRVSDKSNEIPNVKPLLDPLNIKGAIVTADALHVQTETAEYLVKEKEADYLMTVKENQPTLLKDIQDLQLEVSSPPSPPDDR